MRVYKLSIEPDHVPDRYPVLDAFRAVPLGLGKIIAFHPKRPEPNFLIKQQGADTRGAGPNHEPRETLLLRPCHDLGDEFPAEASPLKPIVDCQALELLYTVANGEHQRLPNGHPQIGVEEADELTLLAVAGNFRRRVIGELEQCEVASPRRTLGNVDDDSAHDLTIAHNDRTPNCILLHYTWSPSLLAAVDV